MHVNASNSHWAGFANFSLTYFSIAVDLNLVITPETLAPLLSNPEIRNRLIPFLPAGEDLPQDESQLLLTLQSPHFQQVCREIRKNKIVWC
jgi:hypothetical protein